MKLDENQDLSLLHTDSARRPRKKSRKRSSGFSADKQISRIFCFERSDKGNIKKSKFKQKMKSNKKYRNMMKRKAKKRNSGFNKNDELHESSQLLSFTASSLSSEWEEQTEEYSENCKYFFLSLTRLASVFLKNLGKPKQTLKTLIFLCNHAQLNPDLTPPLPPRKSNFLFEEDLENFKLSIPTPHNIKKSKLRIIPKDEDFNEIAESFVSPHDLDLNTSNDSLEVEIRECRRKLISQPEEPNKKIILNLKEASRMNYLLGQTYLELGKSDKTEEHLINAHVYDPFGFDCLLLLASSLRKEGQLSRSERFYRKAHFLRPENGKALQGLVETNLKLERFSFLVKFAKKTDLANIQDAQTCLLLGKGVLTSLRSPRKIGMICDQELARALCNLLFRAEECLSLSNSKIVQRKEASIRNDIALMYFRVSRFRDGIRCLLHTAAYYRSRLTLYNLAYAYLKIDKLGKAKTFIDETLSMRPNHFKSRLLKAEILKKSSDLKMAQKLLLELSQEDPRNSTIHKMLGEIYKFKGSFFQAIEHFEKAVMLNPMDKVLRFELQELKNNI